MVFFTANWFRQPKFVADYNKSTWEVLTSQIDSLQNTIFSVKLTSIEKRSFSFYRYSDCKCICLKQLSPHHPHTFLPPVWTRGRKARRHHVGGQDLSRCAYVLCWQSALTLSLSVSSLAQAGGMACMGWPSGCMLGDGARGSASFDPQHAGAPFCDVICIWYINFY